MLVAPTPLFLLSLVATEPSGAIAAPEPSALAARLAVAAPQERRYGYAWNPEWTLSLGVHGVTGYYDTFNGEDPDEDLAYSLDACIYNWEGERGLGFEFGVMYSTYSVPTGGLGGDDDVDTYRLSVGVRLADRGPDDPWYVPYVRAGGMFRKDNGSLSDDDGFGWYAGGGIDLRLGGRIALTPSVLFTDTASNSAQEWVYGLLLTVGF